MGMEVGYYVYLPKGYDLAKNAERKYPVVYHLHGGRPGSEKKSISLSAFIDQAMTNGRIQPTIYVFPNGGPMSWYNYPQKENGMGEDIFVKELIPHVDATYRTHGTRTQRGLQGFSQGGRGTTRIMFKYPGHFGSTAPGGSGYEPEERIRDNDGEESSNVRFAKGYDAWTLAKKYSTRKNAPLLKPMIWVGTKGFNYEYNLKFMKYLDKLGVPYEKLIVADAPHSAKIIYEKKGLKLMQFHDRNFSR
jgi:endo-1,4-beta-xylanase